MKFEDIDPVAREAERIEHIKVQMREALADLDQAKYMWIVAARMISICAELSSICASREWRLGFEAGSGTHIAPRIGGGVVVTDAEVQ